MSAVLFSYFLISYSFSGFLCYLAFQKHLNRQLYLAELPIPILNPQLGNLAIPFFWPIWVVQESFKKNRANNIGQHILTKARIRIMIPSTYCQEPVISHLTSQYGLTFNITGARLNANNQSPGIFDLELTGTPQQIQKALDYLVTKQIKIWGKPNPDGDAW